MTAHILVPLDGSSLAEAALPDAVMLARHRAAGLLLLHIDPHDPADHDENRYDINAYLQGVQQRLASLGVPVTSVIDTGDPALCILHHIEHTASVQLVAMATHGRTGLRRWVMGSVTAAICRAASKPILIIRPRRITAAPGANSRYQTIMVPLDGSPTAAMALPYARELAGQMQARLILVGVAPELKDLLHGVGDTVPLWTKDVLDQQKAALRVYLETTATTLAAIHPAVETRLLPGRPATAILAAVQAAGAEILVMATHGRSGLQRLRYGSVTTQVLQGARVPILLINAAADDEAHHKAAGGC